MPTSNIVTAADYADAMMIARRARTWLFFFLLVMLLVQLGIFFTAKYTTYILPETPADTISVAPAPTTAPAPKAADPMKIRAICWYVTAIINFMGIILVTVLALDLLLIVNIMLVGRLVGVAQVTGAWIWCIVLAVLIFPWQSFLQTADFQGDFKLPGVLYTWGELIQPVSGARFKGQFTSDNWSFALLRWARFAGFPVLCVILLLAIQIKSSRGMRAALGEGDIDGTDVAVA